MQQSRRALTLVYVWKWWFQVLLCLRFCTICWWLKGSWSSLAVLTWLKARSNNGDRPALCRKMDGAIFSRFHASVLVPLHKGKNHCMWSLLLGHFLTLSHFENLPLWLYLLARWTRAWISLPGRGLNLVNKNKYFYTEKFIISYSQVSTRHVNMWMTLTGTTEKKNFHEGTFSATKK